MHDPEVQNSLHYLGTGGLGEVAGLTELAMNRGHPKVTCDTTMTMALCILAAEGLKRPIKASSAEVSTAAARLMAMDNDEMRKTAVYSGIMDDGEPRLTPEFCDLVRSIAASVVSQDETNGQQ